MVEDKKIKGIGDKIIAWAIVKIPTEKEGIDLIKARPIMSEKLEGSIFPPCEIDFDEEILGVVPAQLGDLLAYAWDGKTLIKLGFELHSLGGRVAAEQDLRRQMEAERAFAERRKKGKKS